MALVAGFLRFEPLVSLLGFFREMGLGPGFRVSQASVHVLVASLFPWVGCGGDLFVGPHFILRRLGCGCPFLFGSGFSFDR
jgi:hypothetical protein